MGMGTSQTRSGAGPTAWAPRRSTPVPPGNPMVSNQMTRQNFLAGRNTFQDRLAQFRGMAPGAEKAAMRPAFDAYRDSWNQARSSYRNPSPMPFPGQGRGVEGGFPGQGGPFSGVAGITDDFVPRGPVQSGGTPAGFLAAFGGQNGVPQHSQPIPQPQRQSPQMPAQPMTGNSWSELIQRMTSGG